MVNSWVTFSPTVSLITDLLFMIMRYLLCSSPALLITQPTN